MSDPDRERLLHMRDAAREALSFAEGKTREDLLLDRMFLLSVVKEIEIVGEAAARVSNEGRSEVPGVPWALVTAMRNRLTHGYFDWDLDVIWSTLKFNLPTLVAALDKTLAG